ncbi:hypothetical protein KIL84_008675 [Mauremys mutica]|uniref:Uncharacterized protein n=1 Tax=Mauremys mutica TaxID=74926 RepID=A0A9D3X3C2_9SAUR|nr:hypothetical protein KIL84_008675 [Mauremys mutica]
MSADYGSDVDTNFFPEILIGDSEDTFKKPPTGKNIFRTRRDVRLISPLSADEESHQSNSLADSVERRELHEMGEEEEEEEGEPHQVVPGNITADGCSGLAVKEISEHPENSSGDSESYCLLDEDSILSDSAVSTGYFPCYRTYGELPRYQPPRSASSQAGNAEGRAGSSCDASVQCSGCSEEDLKVSDTRASDTTQSSRDRGETLTCETVPSNPNAPSGGPLAEGNRHRPSGKEFEGQKDRDSSQQHLVLETQRGFGPEVSENLKEPEDTLTKEAASELLVPGGTPSVSLGKDSGQLPGTEPQSSLLPSKGKVPTSLDSAAITKKSSPKKQQKQCRKEEEEVRRAKLAPLLGLGDAVPGRKRGSRFPCGHSPETGHCEPKAIGARGTFQTGTVREWVQLRNIVMVPQNPAVKSDS